jgi:hypothetical protein
LNTLTRNCDLSSHYQAAECRTYLLTAWSRVLFENLTGLELVQKFPAFYGTRRFITAFTSVHHKSILSQLNPVHAPTSHFLKSVLNSILKAVLGNKRIIVWEHIITLLYSLALQHRTGYGFLVH